MSDSPRVRQKSLNDRLAERTGTVNRKVQPAPILQSAAQTRLAQSDEVAVAVVGALIVQKLAEFGQTRLYQRAADQIIERLTQQLTSPEVMELEVEAYELMDFLAGRAFTTDEHPAAHRDGGRILYDPTASPLDLIQRAIDEGFDVKIDYFSRRRGEMNTRRITPRAVRAETYVNAFCHARQSERVFRISRITRCIPIHGTPDRPPASKPSIEHERDGGPAQLSLLDE